MAMIYIHHDKYIALLNQSKIINILLDKISHLSYYFNTINNYIYYLSINFLNRILNY
jgi:hypothetical protein